MIKLHLLLQNLFGNSLKRNLVWQAIAQEDEERTKDYERSVKRRLADVASQKALSEGERLAEYILEDLLLEAAVDLSK